MAEVAGRARLRRGTLAVALAVVAGCAQATPSRPSALHVTTSGAARVRLRSPQHVVAYGVATFVARDDLTLDAIKVDVPPDMTLLATRLAYLDGPVGPAFQGYQGAVCLDRWPPAGFGPTREVAGTVLRAGERVGIAAYVRARGTGLFSIGGYSVVFRGADGRRRHLHDSYSDLTVEVLAPGEPSTRRGCEPVRDDPWLR